MRLKEHRYQSMSSCCMIGYIFFILYMTLFSRDSKESFQYNFHPFWSYHAIIDGREDLVRENYLNILLFIPFGILLWCVLRQKKWWAALTAGCTLSLGIEVIQLMLKRGFCEFDDVFHNSLGTMIGYGLMAGIVTVLYKQYIRRNCASNGIGYSQK